MRVAVKLLLISNVSLQGDDFIIVHVDLNLSDKLDAGEHELVGS